jgi:acetoin utilization deacetylase AcuC-like enzyme
MKRALTAGHHASYDRAQGGCYLNSVAVAARAAQASGAATRVMIVDWDVHFGQGTQSIFDQDDSVMYVSLHREDRWARQGSRA